MFRLRTFGGLTLERDGVPSTGPATQRRRLALLAVLAAADGPVTRDRLMGFLWPEADPDRARHSLDDALSALRRELRSETLFLGVASVRVNPEVLSSDAADHTSAIRSGAAEQAAALYTGPFLDGFYVPGAAEFERWAESERSRRSQAHVRVLEGLATAAAANGDGSAAVRWWQARVAVDPLNTPATLRLLEALAATGHHADAIRAARVHEALVREAFDTAPPGGWSAAVAALHAEITRPTTITPVVAIAAQELSAEPRPPYAPELSSESLPEPLSVPSPLPAAPAHALEARPPLVNVAATTVGTQGQKRRWGSVALLVAGALALFVLGRFVLKDRLPATTRAIAPATPTSREVPRVSVAVLPFANVGGQASDEPFADGLTDELIGALSRSAGIRVTGRTSAFALKGRGLDVRVIADTLGVTTVLEGSVRRDGDRLRVTAQLVSARDNGVLWADTYERKLADVFAVQAEIAQAIVVALVPALGGRAAESAPVRTRDLATYELYLKGRYFWGRRTPDDLRRAAEYFEQAIARDSTYAQAYAGLADSRMLLVMLGDSPPGEELPQARAAANAALRLDSGLAEAHAARGNILEAFDWDSAGADQEMAQALALDPGYASAHLYRGIHLLNRARFEDAIAQLIQARTLDPLSAPVRMQLGRAYVFARRPDLAIASLQTAVELNPGFSAAHTHLGDAHLQRDEPAAALAAYRRAAALNGGRDSANVAYGLAMTGRRDEAARLLRAFVNAPGRYLPPVPVAKAYVALGDADAAFRWLESGVDERAAGMRTIPVTPAFDPLHADPRWTRLLRRMRVRP